jgi:hypothetical protein
VVLEIKPRALCIQASALPLSYIPVLKSLFIRAQTVVPRLESVEDDEERKEEGKRMS